MCNRYFQEHQAEKLARIYGASRTAILGEQVATDVYPTYRPAVVRNREGVREIVNMHWGLILPWVKEADLAKFSKPNNARDDTIIKSLVEKKGMFYAPMKNNRCILPATGWCEWTGQKGSMVANRLSVKGQESIHFAGLYSYREGHPGLSCTMITTAAEGEAAKFHHRIPVILLTDADVTAWLDPASDPMELAHRFFKCIPDELLQVEVREEDQRKVKAKPAKSDPDSLDIV